MPTASSDFTDDLRLAHVLADDADSISESRFKALDLHVMSKPDLSPVTDADQAVEESIRRTLSRARSRDAITGEEQGSSGHSQRRGVRAAAAAALVGLEGQRRRDRAVAPEGQPLPGL